ncbi:MAG: hypothetical protein ACM3X4_13780 [Ignavibacteriales bacterium]
MEQAPDREIHRMHMSVLRRSCGSRVVLWFTDSEVAQQVTGVLALDGTALCVTIAPGTACPHHGCFKAEIYTSTGVRALSGFAVLSQPTEIRLFPLGSIVHRERRRSIRVPLDVPVSYRLLGFGGHDLRGQGGTGSGRTVDVGLTGMGFTTGIRLPHGLVIGVTAKADGWSDFGELECTVNRFERTLTCWKTGIVFSRPSEQFKRYLNRFVLHQSRAMRERGRAAPGRT